MAVELEFHGQGESALSPFTIQFIRWSPSLSGTKQWAAEIRMWGATSVALQRLRVAEEACTIAKTAASPSSGVPPMTSSLVESISVPAQPASKHANAEAAKNGDVKAL